MRATVVSSDATGSLSGALPRLPHRAPMMSRVERNPTALIAFLCAHVVLAILVRVQPAIATGHAILIFMLVVWGVLRWRPLGLAFLAAYIAGTDVMWRMMHAQVPWESSKYLVAVLCLGGILRMGRRARWHLLALVYFVALLPSIAVVARDFQGGLSELAQPLSFNLSGPLALFASVWFFSQLRLTRHEVRALMVSVIAPIITIATIALIATREARQLTFTDESSTATSGGFGPNQVSLVLGLGALLALLLAVDPQLKPWRRWSAFGIVLFFGVQSALTFSRGGVYSFASAFIPAAFLFWWDRSSRRWVTVLTAVLVTVAIMVVIPRLDEFTGGEFSTRFADTNPGHRSEIVREDLRLWGEHPILGLGPGGARLQRRGPSTIAHTEYSRLLSEHGVFGLIALVALLTICVKQLTRRQPTQERALRIAFLFWSMASMFHVGMRIAAVSLVFGWGCARALLSRDRITPVSDPGRDVFRGTGAPLYEDWAASASEAERR